MAQRNRKNSIIIYRKKRQENNEMNDLDKVYVESVAKEYMPRETNKVRQLKKLDERAKLPAFISAMTLNGGYERNLVTAILFCCLHYRP